MARVLVYLMEAPRTRLLGLEAPKYTPSLLEIEVDLRVVVEEPFGNCSTSNASLWRFWISNADIRPTPAPSLIFAIRSHAVLRRSSGPNIDRRDPKGCPC